MRNLKVHSLLKPVNNYVVDAPQPSNISYWWNVGSLLGLSLVIQIISGVTLAMHYNSSVSEAFNSVEHIMRDVHNGWLIRYLHSNTASAFFFLVYLHMGKGLYYGSYKAPRTLVWTIGTFILILMMGIAFLGYVLPYGQMSLWGATVITSLISAIPWIGQDIVEFVWGGFSVNNATLNRFFSLHFVLPFLLAALVLLHLVSLHDRAGSGNPLGTSANGDRISFAPHYVFKDLITVYVFMLLVSLFAFFAPNVLGDSENYVVANPMQTPSAIVPEWYLLPFYAVLRSIPNKLSGVIAMFSAIVVILIMAFVDLAKLRGMQFKPLNRTVFFLFASNLIFLMTLGAKHVESPFILLGQLATAVYFIYYILSVPLGALMETASLRVTLYIENIFLFISKIIENFLRNSGPLGHTFVIKPQASMPDPTPGVKCPECGKNGINVWVAPGKNCPVCGHTCKRTAYSSAFSILLTFTSITAIGVITNTYLFDLNFFESIVQILESTKLCFFNLFTIDNCDAPRPWGTYFQDSASPQMEALVELHDNIMFYLVIILFAVGWLLSAVASEDANGGVSNKYVSHGTLIELIWTMSPGLILVFISFTSFKLLYLMDEVSDVNMTLYIEGHQWYWSYQYPDFMTDDGDFIEYDSYLIPESDLQDGALRMLDVDERVVIPEVTHTRFLVSSGDVIHSYACPSLGIKADAYPGRLNQASTLINRLGTFYGQCSEICGILHSSMPITIQSVSIEKFLVFLENK